jgi:hypothetical protein
MSKYVETVMTASETVLDGSWKEDNTYPVSEEMIKNREMHIVDIMKKYKWTHEKAAEWVDTTFYTVKRHDGLRTQIKQRPDGTWAWMVHMKYTYEQQRFYDYVCTM